MLAQLFCSFPPLPFPFQDHKKCATLLILVVPWANVGICSSLQCSREHKMTSINFMLLLSPSPICSPSRALPSALASSTVLEPSSSGGMRVSLHQDFLHSDMHLCWLPQISLQAGLQPSLSSANLASWFQGAREPCFLCLSHIALWVLLRQRVGPE